MKTVKHDGVTFRVEKFTFEYVPEGQNPTRYQAFYGDYAISEIEKNEAIAIMFGIKTINEKRSSF